MLRFLFAPLAAFFSPRLYRTALQSGMGRGFGYLCYLTFLFCVFVALLCQFYLLPLTRSFTDWLIQVTPEMTLTESGLEVGISQPYLVIHPAFVPLYVIDTSKGPSELLSDQSGAPVLIGKEHVVLRYGGRSETRVIDLKQILERARESKTPAQLTKNLMRQLVDRLRTFLIPVTLLFLAPLFFIWKLFSPGVYSISSCLSASLRANSPSAKQGTIG